MSASVLSALSSLNAAVAQESTSPLAVSAIVAPRCQLGVIDAVNFGDILQSASAQIDQGFTISVTCISGSEYTLTLDAGQNYIGGMRRMAKGESVIAYRLFGDAVGSLEIGDAGVDDTYPFNGLSGVGTGVSVSYSFIATAYLGSSETSMTDQGVHSDLVTVKVTF